MYPPAYDQAECARRYEIVRMLPPRIFERIWFAADDNQAFDMAVDEAAAELLGRAIAERAAP